MMKPWIGNLNHTHRLWGIALIVSAAAALLAGCKGNTTSAADIERVIGPPPTLIARLAPADLHHADPLASPAWQAAQWATFSSPAGTTHTTTASKAALLFDPNTLYVAFVSEKQPFPDGGSNTDTVSLYLDTTPAGRGTELVEITVDAAGAVHSNWIRSVTPAAPREDGYPDLGHPVSTFPNITIDGLWSEVATGTDPQGKPVWTAVVAVPLHALPLPLQTTAQNGGHWKFNLIRTVSTYTDPDHRHRIQRLQSNLSPIFVDTQPIAPYRLADLSLSSHP